MSNADKKWMFLTAWRQAAPTMPEPVTEYKFAPPRKFPFDWAWPEYKIAVEVDGGTWLPHGGKHGKDTDREKTNLAAEMGWRVFRFSVDMLTRDPAGCVDQVMRTMARKSKCQN